MNLLILALLIALLLAIRVPVGLAFLGPSLLYMLMSGNSPGFAMRIAAEGTASFPLLAVPLFILLGTLANAAGIADRIFDFALAVLGRVRGSLGYVNVASSVGFAWMSGSALADSAALGKIMVPAMERNGYKRDFAVGLTSSAALISPVMPPSIPAVIFASVATISTGALFAASVLPAFLLAAALCLTVFIYVRRHSELKATPRSRAEIKQATLRVIGPLLTPVIILGGILGGFFTPTEAAAIGVLYILALGFSYRTLDVKRVVYALRDTAVTTASIMLIIAAAALLGWVLSREQVPQNLADMMTENISSPIVFLLIVNLLLIVLGAFIDATAVILITVPVLLPIAIEFGVDPVHFGVIMILNLMIGLLTPPVGSVLFVMSSVLRTPIEQVFKGTAPFLIPMFAVLLLLTFFPGIVTIVPNLLGY